MYGVDKGIGPLAGAVTLDRGDLIHPFQIEGVEVRGRLVRLARSIHHILKSHNYPDAVSTLLGEALALVAALGGMLKFEGMLTLQTKGDGPISMLLADWRTGGDLRGYASFDAARLATVLATGPATLDRLLGQGYLAFTIDQGADMERYQGIVAIEGASLAEAAERYFGQSEQIHASFRLAAGKREGRWRASCLMIQRLPQQSPIGAPPSPKDVEREDAWHRANLLIATVGETELLEPALEANMLLYRLFHEDGVRVYTPLPVQARCRCDAERVRTVLRSFGAEELADMMIDGRISVTCEFCSAGYEFSAEDVQISP